MKAGPGAAAALLAVAGIVWFTQRRPDPATPSPRTQWSIDSLAVTRPSHLAAQDSSRRRAAAAVAVGARHDVAADRALAAADSLAHVIDSLRRQPAAIADTSSPWRAIADSLEHETGTLRVVVRERTASRDSARSALRETESRAARDSARTVALEQLQTRLERELRTAGQCRVLFVVRCPTRTEAVVGGVILGVLAKREFDRRR